MQQGNKSIILEGNQQMKGEEGVTGHPTPKKSGNKLWDGMALETEKMLDMQGWDEPRRPHPQHEN